VLTAGRPRQTSRTISATGQRGMILPTTRVLPPTRPARGQRGKLLSTRAVPVVPIPTDQEASTTPGADIPSPTLIRIRMAAGARIRGPHHPTTARVPARPDTAEVRTLVRLRRDSHRPRDSHRRRDSHRLKAIRRRRIESVVAPTGRMRKRSYVFEKNTPSASSSFATLIRLVGATPGHNLLSTLPYLISGRRPSTRRRAPL